MSQPRAVRPPVVSLQSSGAEDPHAGHLAVGLLVTPSMVFVPSPPDELLDLTGRFEVLIFPTSPVAGDPLIERIAPVGLTVPYAGMHARPPLAATIALARPSRNALSIRRKAGAPAITAAALELTLSEGRDLWGALAHLGAVNATAHRAPTRATWNRLADAQVDTRRPPKGQRPADGGSRSTSSQARGFNACWLVPWWCIRDPS